jgi:hypothetical protein
MVSENEERDLTSTRGSARSRIEVSWVKLTSAVRSQPRKSAREEVSMRLKMRKQGKGEEREGSFIWGARGKKKGSTKREHLGQTGVKGRERIDK